MAGAGSGGGMFSTKTKNLRIEWVTLLWDSLYL